MDRDEAGYAWFSRTCFERFGGFTAEATIGGEVLCTEIFNDSDRKSGWPDAVCMGRVRAFSGRPDWKRVLHLGAYREI